MTSSFIDSPNGTSLSIKEAYEFRITDNKGWLDSIGIKPFCQNKGYGNILLDQSISYLYSLGIEKIEMMVDDSNIHAYNLYLKTVFKKKKFYLPGTNCWLTINIKKKSDGQLI